jgi:hypothetical protein
VRPGRGRRFGSSTVRVCRLPPLNRSDPRPPPTAPAAGVERRSRGPPLPWWGPQVLRAGTSPRRSGAAQGARRRSSGQRAQPCLMLRGVGEPTLRQTRCVERSTHAPVRRSVPCGVPAAGLRPACGWDVDMGSGSTLSAVDTGPAISLLTCPCDLPQKEQESSGAFPLMTTPALGGADIAGEFLFDSGDVAACGDEHPARLGTRVEHQSAE